MDGLGPPDHLATSDMLLAVIPAPEHGWLWQQQGELRQALGMESLPQRQNGVARLRVRYSRSLAVAEELDEVMPATEGTDALATVTS